MLYVACWLAGVFFGAWLLNWVGMVCDDLCPKCRHPHKVPIGRCGKCGWECEG